MQLCREREPDRINELLVAVWSQWNSVAVHAAATVTAHSNPRHFENAEKSHSLFCFDGSKLWRWHLSALMKVKMHARFPSY